MKEINLYKSHKQDEAKSYTIGPIARNKYDKVILIDNKLTWMDGRMVRLLYATLWGHKKHFCKHFLYINLYL